MNVLCSTDTLKLDFILKGEAFVRSKFRES